MNHLEGPTEAEIVFFVKEARSCLNEIQALRQVIALVGLLLASARTLEWRSSRDRFLADLRAKLFRP